MATGGVDIREVYELMQHVHKGVDDLRHEMVTNNAAVREELVKQATVVREELSFHYRDDEAKHTATTADIRAIRTWGSAGLVVLTVVGILVPILAR